MSKVPPAMKHNCPCKVCHDPAGYDYGVWRTAYCSKKCYFSEIDPATHHPRNKMNLDRRIHKLHPAHPNHDYDPNSPFRTETQRLRNMDIDENEHHAKNFPRDMKLLAAILLGIGCIVAFALGFVVGA